MRIVEKSLSAGAPPYPLNKIGPEGRLMLLDIGTSGTVSGNGRILIEFKNADTDHVPTGNYPMERRYVINPTWELDEGASIPTEDCANALTSGARIIDGPIVRVPKYGQSSLTLTDIYGEV